MDHLEAQKERIQQFFSGVVVNGIIREIKFRDAEEGYIQVELCDDVANSLSVHLSIPIKEQDPQAAVVADIMGKAVQSSQDDNSGITLLFADRYGDSIVCVLNEYMDHRVTQCEDDRLNKIGLSNETMDRLCAAWIAWRVKHYEPPTGEAALGDLDDHPF